MDILFTDKDGKEYLEEDVYQALKSVNADDCDALFIHSDVTFGMAPTDFNKKEYLSALYNSIQKLNVHYLIVPTFTYSFCNHEDYDVKKSRTSMGAFNEFLRKLPNRYRTLDPLLSISVPSDLKIYFDHISEHSLGKGSGLDVVHNSKFGKVKFLFFGARLYDCFTYLHYVEKMKEVPYRFDMAFSGKVTNEQGQVHERTQYIHTACTGVTLREDTRFEDYLIEAGYLKKVRLGDSFVSCISEEDAYREINQALERDINHFLMYPFRESELIKKYTYDPSKKRITHC